MRSPFSRVRFLPLKLGHQGLQRHGLEAICGQTTLLGQEGRPDVTITHHQRSAYELSSERVLNYPAFMATLTDRDTVFQSSDLSRSSAEVFAAATDHPVEVTRRDGESLVLMSQTADRARDSLLELAAQLIAVSTSVEGTLAERMSDRFPWMLALNVKDRELCATEILVAARASFATKQPHLAIAELTSWRETATAMAAGFNTATVDWLDADDIEDVERP